MVENLEVYETIKRWLTKLEAKSRSLDFSKSSTKRAGLYWVKRYCKHKEGNPDSLIRARMEEIQSTNLMTQRRHEEYVEDFHIYLRREGYSPNTISTAIGMVRSFYKANYGDLKEVTSVRPHPVRGSKVPNIKDIKNMCKIADIPIKSWILCQFESGLANTDLLSLRLSTVSSEFGTIKRQLKNDTIPIHVEIRRQKTAERTDSFFGPNASEALKEYVNLNRNGRIFELSARSVQQKVKAVGIKSKAASKDRPITPYSLRRAFNTHMKLAGVNEALVERMMGHSIGRVRSAYLVTGSDDTITGIPISKLAEIYMEAYPAIDITKV